MFRTPKDCLYTIIVYIIQSRMRCLRLIIKHNISIVTLHDIVSNIYSYGNVCTQ